MTETGRVRTSVPLPKFSGKSEEWVRYWQQFGAFAKVNKFKKSVMMTLDSELPEREDMLSSDATILIKEEMAIERNDIAISFLTLSLQMESEQVMIEKSKTEARPDSLAHTVVVALHEKFLPDDIMTGVDFATELSKVNMGERGSPSSLFEQISTIKNNIKRMPQRKRRPTILQL